MSRAGRVLSEEAVDSRFSRNQVLRFSVTAFLRRCYLSGERATTAEAEPMSRAQSSMVRHWRSEPVSRRDFMRRSRAIWDSISESLRFANIFQRVPGGVDAGNPVTKVRVSAIVNPAS